MTWTREELDELIQECELDLRAYKGALDRIQQRKADVEGSSHEAFFTKSSGCQATIHVLIMNISSTEGIIEDLMENREKLIRRQG